MNVLFENDGLLVVDKPGHLASALGDQPSCEAWFRESHPTGGGLLHRLDNATTGALAFAKNDQVFQEMRDRWAGPSIQKTYRAWVSAVEHPEMDITSLKLPYSIDYPIGHSAKSQSKMIAIKNPGTLASHSIRGNPRDARTIVEAITTDNRGHFDVTLRIDTGVRHQIRAHTRALGWPIVGDTSYQGKPSSRLWLHAWKLSLPTASGPQEIVAPLPENWGNIESAE